MGLGSKTLAEIESQPQLWTEALRQFEQRADELQRLWSTTSFDEIIFTGCGSTYYAGMVGAALLQAGTGITARAVSATELMLFPEMIVSAHRTTLLICVSRSGTTRETVAAAEMFRNHGGHSIVVVTCSSESPLAQTADVLVAIDAAQEESRVQTRSFSSMLLAVTALAALFTGRDWRILASMPERLERLTLASAETVERLGRDLSITQFVFLGSGALYGLACEAMLKMTEMAKLFSAAYHPLEYLHGPHYTANATTQLIGLLSDGARAEELRVFNILHGRGLALFTLCDANRLLPVGGTVITLDSDLPEWGRGLLYLPPLQRICWLQAVERGFDPDNLAYRPQA
ncbi:MAG: SIS domain-containing protein [Anaerolineae bacterium]|nr:SIS domain-containing protein [Anaerolineae bacterium]